MGFVFKSVQILVLVFALIIVGLYTTTASAQSISITPVQTLTFPILARPTSGNTTNLSISPLNSTTSGTGTIVGGAATRGQYTISITSGGSPVSISLDITGITTGNAGLTLDTFRGFYAGQTISSFPSSTLPLPATTPSNTPLYLGAKVTADSTVASGSYSASFSITVFLQ